MNNTILSLPWGKDKISLALPPSWIVDGVLEPAALDGVADLDKELRRAACKNRSVARDFLP